MNTYAIILAGGTGSRAGTELPKQFVELNGIPVIAYSMTAFENNKAINGIIVVSHPDYLDFIQEIALKFNIKKLMRVTKGGTRRRDSSYAGLSVIAGNADDIVLIHDAARPFIDNEIIDDCIRKAAECGACGAYVPSIDTIALAENGKIQSVPKRENCFQAQTPQGFRFGLIKEAHERASEETEYTDDVSMILNKGGEVAVSSGKQSNFKITTPDDFNRALIYLSQNK